jgi:hypothetical protein
MSIRVCAPWTAGEVETATLADVIDSPTGKSTEPSTSFINVEASSRTISTSLVPVLKSETLAAVASGVNIIKVTRKNAIFVRPSVEAMVSPM